MKYEKNYKHETKESYKEELKEHKYNAHKHTLKYKPLVRKRI